MNPTRDLASKPRPLARLVAGLASLPGVAPLLRPLSLAGWLPERLLWNLRIERRFQVELPGLTPFEYHLTPPDLVGRALYWMGPEACEPETLRLFAPLAREARGFVDVGANSGLFTLAALAASGEARALAFEPLAPIRAMLTRNLEVNGFTSRCEVAPAAVSDRPGRTRIGPPVETELLPRCGDLPSTWTIRNDPEDGVETEVVTLDEACASRGLAPDLIKIDTEGVEHLVLAGASRVLRDHRPAVLFECFAQYCTGGEAAAIDATLRDHGYAIWHLTAAGPRPVDDLNAVALDPARDPGRNFLALPDGREPPAAA